MKRHGIPCLLLLATYLATGFGSPARAAHWAERLGYPADARVVILQAAEMGVAYEFNAVGKQLAAEGPCRSFSVVAAAPWFQDFAQASRQEPMGDVGIALCFLSDGHGYRFGPVAPRNEVPSLVDNDGMFPSLTTRFELRATVADVEHELRAQIERARMAGLQPTHLNSQRGLLVLRHDLAKVYLQVSIDNWIPAVMVDLTPALLERFRAAGFPLEDEMVALVRAYPLPKLDDLYFSPVGETYEEKRERLFELLRTLPPGLTQIQFQPALDSPALPSITPDPQQRVWDAQLLADPQLKELLADEDIIVTNWKEVMERFEGAPRDVELSETEDAAR